MSSASIILAVDNLGFLRMQLQTARTETLTDHPQQQFGLRLALAVNQAVIRVSAPLHMAVVELQPLIERIMQKEIRQYWANDTALWRTPIPLNTLSIRQLHRRHQPPRNI